MTAESQARASCARWFTACRFVASATIGLAGCRGEGETVMSLSAGSEVDTESTSTTHSEPASSSSETGTQSGTTTGTSEESDGSSSGGESDHDEACEIVDPFPSTIEDASGLSARSGSIQFVARDGNSLTAYTHRSAAFDERDGPIVFIMHGAGRNAEGYLNQWRDFIDEHGALALAPEFPSASYPGSEAYNLGVGVDGTPYGGTHDPDAWRDPADYTHSEIEHLFEAVRAHLTNASCRYFIYGHSAGGQFVHRLLTFRPDARVAKAVAANPGWYTLPSTGSGDDPNFYMPYGLQGAPPDRTRLERMFEHELIVLLGEDDVLRDDALRKTVEADAQGLNRFERGQFYFMMAHQEALRVGASFHWVLDTVPGVGHSNGGMTPAAAAHLFGR
jgi:predicted esterase